jgi:hypothetical protein
MGDNDFPAIVGGGGGSDFLTSYLQKNGLNTILPTTTEYQLSQQPTDPWGGAPQQVIPQSVRDEYEIQRTPPPPGFRDQLNLPSNQGPGQGAKQAFGTQFPTPFGGSEFDVAAGPSFEIPKGQGALGGRSGEQLLRLQQGSGNMENQQLQNELQRRGIMPSGIQLPPV